MQRRIAGKKVTTFFGSWPEMPADAARDEALRIVRAGSTPPPQRKTVADLALEFSANYRTRRKGRLAGSDRDVVRRLSAIQTDLGSVPLASLSTPMVQRLLSRYDATPYERNRVRALLRQLWNYAQQIRWIPAGAWSPVTPTSEMRERKRNRSLTIDETASLLAAIGALVEPVPRALLLIAFHTAARVGEMRNLRWENVSSGRMTLRDTKSGRDISYPITPEIRSALDSLGIHTVSGPVFLGRAGRPISEPRRAWCRACMDANLIGVQMKDLRHARATQWLRMGIPVDRIRRALGHANIGTTYRYLDVRDDEHEPIFFLVDGDDSHRIETPSDDG